MITNPAWFALLPAILLASLDSVSAKERIVPAINEPVQVIPVNMARHPGKATSGALLFSPTRLSKNNSLSCASCCMLESDEDDANTGPVRLKESGQVYFHQAVIENKGNPIQIDRETS